MFDFDDLGYIKPYDVHELTLEEFERTFVIDYGRERLFKILMNFVADLKHLGAGEFYIWADGSFVTKKRTPGDIDLVCFIPYLAFEKIDHKRMFLKDKYESALDIFFVQDFPENHFDYKYTVLDKMKWQEAFCFDRINRRKGIIQLNF